MKATPAALVGHPVRLGDHVVLRPLLHLLDDDLATHFLGIENQEEKDLRRASDGFICITGNVGRQAVGIVLNDGKIDAGTLGERALSTLLAFIEMMSLRGTTLVFLLDTAGARVHEGVAGVANFKVIAALQRFARMHLLITCAYGRTLAIGALIHAMGHYRLGIEGKSLSLAGADLIQQFFGANDATAKASAVEDHVAFQSALVHKQCADRLALFVHLRQLLGHIAAPGLALRELEPLSPQRLPVQEQGCASPKSRGFMAELLGIAADTWLELFGSMTPVVRVCLCRRKGFLFGLLINSPHNAYNMLTAHSMDKYIEALRLFAVLGVPLVSCVDTPGSDPREAENRRNIIGQLGRLASAILDYPHPKMGVIIGRSFGGASLLTFPRFFGGMRLVVFEGARLGIFDQKIASRFFSASAPGVQAAVLAQDAPEARLDSLVSLGLVDAVIAPQALGAEIDLFLDASGQAGEAR